MVSKLGILRGSCVVEAAAGGASSFFAMVARDIMSGLLYTYLGRSCKHSLSSLLKDLISSSKVSTASAMVARNISVRLGWCALEDIFVFAIVVMY